METPIFASPTMSALLSWRALVMEKQTVMLDIVSASVAEAQHPKSSMSHDNNFTWSHTSQQRRVEAEERKLAQEDTIWPDKN